MLVVSPLSSAKNERESQIQGFSMEAGNEYPEFTGGNFLDSIDFDDLFVGLIDGDALPDLEMDPEFLADFSATTGEDSDHTNNMDGQKSKDEKLARADKGRKSSANRSKNPPGKKKVKVDWTPELHRRFVQAVEQLGVDKAVPSRILDLMGIDCLTRHNIASHLQKYRSHRKHLLAREAEAASWTQRRQIYGTAAVGGRGLAAKREVNPWIAPSMGFPPVPHFRPLHVWGHPSMDQSLVHMWPKHVASLQRPWPLSHPPHPLPPDPSFWRTRPHQYVPAAGTPCYPMHLPQTKFPSPAVPGLPPPATYKVEPAALCVPAGQTLSQPPTDVHPSNESIDAAIGDVIAKPWLPLPLGLKPPSIDCVMVELKRQGIPKVPPSTSV